MRITLLTLALITIAACGNRTITMTVDTAKLGDATAAKLAKQLDSINYPATVTYDADTVNVRVSAASVSDVRRAMWRRMGWPSEKGKMVRMADTIRVLRVAGVTKLKLVGDAQTLDVETERRQGGRRTRLSAYTMRVTGRDP